MHLNEWIKKYSPINEIYKQCEVARLLKLSPNTMNNRLAKGAQMADQQKPKLVEAG